ncbi:MAG TPA: ATP-binding protein [Gemmatimonadaceae bacterium]|nr:ATP-binding protein [Gemmatimonadaceae bacterium]
MPNSRSAPAVLLVDDRPENLLALEGVLATLCEETGCRLLRANGADQALRHLLEENDNIALVLLDVMMPGTNGLETAGLIRSRSKNEHVPIIFITALDADRRRVTLGYQYGAVDYLTKPVQPDVLVAKVRAFLELHERRGEAVLEERRRYADQIHLIREQNLRDEAALVETLQRVGTALASELDLERVVQLVTDEATTLTHAQFGAFFYNVIDPARGGEAYTLYTVSGVPRDSFANFPHPRATPIFGPTFRGEGVVRSDDITKDPRYGQMEPYHGMPPGHMPVRSYLAVPVKSRSGDVMGGLFFGHEDPGVFKQREERLVTGIAGWAAVAMDNARLYSAERQAREGAEGATRAKAEFLATMSHEFRTPLNAIVGYAQLLDMGVLGPATPAQHDHLERLQASARHLLQLVDDVLDVAKVDADRLNVRQDLLMSGPAVAAAVTLVQPQSTAKGVRLLDLRMDEPGFPYVGDEHRVRQVLINLLSNSIKFTPSGGQVTIECGTSDDPAPGVFVPTKKDADHESPDSWVFIRVEDTGPGISPALISRLFEPFVQGDGALTREKGGTGLGLAISRRLARLMGGDLTARSEPGSPTQFTLWLPGSHATSAETAAAAAPRPSTGRGSSNLTDLSATQLDPTAHNIVQAIGVRLASEAELIAERYVHALRTDGHFPGAKELSSAQLRDHVTPFVGLLASQLMMIGETRGQTPDLLRDGGQVQRLMSELHGAQRLRLGWSEADIEREIALLLIEVTKALKGSVAVTESSRAVDAQGADMPEIPDAPLRMAAEYAEVVTRHVLEQSARTAIRAYRFAKAADAP